MPIYYLLHTFINDYTVSFRPDSYQKLAICTSFTYLLIYILLKIVRNLLTRRIATEGIFFSC